MLNLKPGKLYKVGPKDDYIRGRFLIIRVNNLDGSGDYHCDLLASWKKGEPMSPLGPSPDYPTTLPSRYDWKEPQELTVDDLMLYISAPYVSLELGRILKEARP